MATAIPLNRCSFDAAEIIDATGAFFTGDPRLRISGVSIDTRNFEPGALFVALHGVRDGHAFVDAAARGKAAAALVERGRRHPTLPCLEVDDTLYALGALARRHLERIRSRHPLPLIAIGGAAGKTTTKQLTAALVRSLFDEILATPGNLNNLIGVPMTALTLTEKHRAAVLECGTNRRGEIHRLGDILRPDIALVLNVDIEHTEGLGSLEGVADEESALFAEAGCAILPVSEELLATRVPSGLRKVTFGAKPPADVQLVERRIIAPGLQQIKLELASSMVAAGLPRHLETTLNLLGAAVAENAAAAIAAAATAWGRPLEREHITAIANALASAHGEAGRLSTREVNGMVIIDDTYNANPRSVRVALAAARETADALHTRLVVALGDMLELGELSGAMHAAAMRDVLAANPDEFIAVGEEFSSAIEALPRHIPLETKIHAARDSAEASLILRDVLRERDVLLVKGSRGIGMERTIESIASPNKV